MNSTAPTVRRFCDMVMKGGITSGVVYPLAITENNPAIHWVSEALVESQRGLFRRQV